jgi:hypothetical protein
VDNTNISITHSNLTDFKEEINIVVEKISNWFQNNLLLLNFNKIYYLHFATKSKLAVDIHISHKFHHIINTSCTNFLGLILDSTLSWKTHIDQVRSKLNSAFYVIRSLKSFISTIKLRTVYFSYVYSIITYGTIFWGNLSYSYNIFKWQERAIRIIMNVDNRISCR